MCRTIKILISNWPRTRKFSHLLQAGKTVAFDFAHRGHALVTLYFQFLCSDWSKCDRWVNAENFCSILNLVYFDSGSWQSFVSTCDVFNCLFPLDAQNKNSTVIRSLLLFMSSWFLVEKYITGQSRKSDFRWHHFRFSPCLMRKGWKVWSDTDLTWYVSGAASRMVSLRDYCIWCLFFISNLMKSRVVYARLWDLRQFDLTENQVWCKLTEL